MRIALAFVALSLRAADFAEVEALADGGHWKRAKALLESRRAPKDARWLWLASRVKLAFSELDDAVKLGEKAAALDPRQAEYQYHLAEVHGTIAYRAPIWKQLGPGRRCKKAMDAAYALDPAHVENLFILMQYYQRAPGFLGGDKARAVSLANEIGKIDPARGWLARATLAALSKDAAAREHAIRKAVNTNPGHFRARLEMAALLRGRGAWIEVREHARAAAAIHPGRVEPHGLLAATAVHLGGLDEALSEAAKAVPDDASPLLSAAGELAAQGKDARPLVERYLAQTPEAGAPSHDDARKLLERKR